MSRERFLLTDKLIVVTGASSGIGAACAVMVAQLGARVALVARREAEMAELAKTLPGTGHVVCPCDLSQPDVCEPLIKDLVAKSGKISGIIHAAGGKLDLPLRVSSADDFLKLYALNTVSAALLAQAMSRNGRVPEGGSSLVLFSSIAAHRGQPALTSYAATKAALEGFLITAAVELAKPKVRVNGLIVGAVDTPMLRDTATKYGPQWWENAHQAQPLGLGRPEDVASVAAFLVSDAARWMTGALVPIDGGFLAS
jgi:NAD(P)-dependent dehydrogenase (short-subunit alcohol dehydrogenase family)